MMSNKLFEFVQFCGNHSLKVILIMMVILCLLLIAMDFLSELSDVIVGILFCGCFIILLALGILWLGTVVHLVLFNLIPFIHMSWAGHVSKKIMESIVYQAVVLIFPWLVKPFLKMLIANEI